MDPFWQQFLDSRMRPNTMSGLIWIKNCLTLRFYSWQNILKKVVLKNVCRCQKNNEILPSMQRLYLVTNVNSLPTSVVCWKLLQTVWTQIGPDLDPNCLTLWWYSWKIRSFWKGSFWRKKIIRQQKKPHKNISKHDSLTLYSIGYF